MAKDGKKPLKNASLDTLAVHAGESADPTTRAHNLPIYQTATFTFETADEKEAAVDGALAWKPDTYFYTRTNNPTTAALEEKLAALEGAESAIASASVLNGKTTATGPKISSRAISMPGVTPVNRVGAT